MRTLQVLLLILPFVTIVVQGVQSTLETVYNVKTTEKPAMVDNNHEGSDGYSISNLTCPPWMTYSNRTGSCHCYNTELGGIVQCNSLTRQVDVLFCYCMTYSSIYQSAVVAHCISACAFPQVYHTVHSNSTTHLDQEVCGPYNRRGQMCGQCLPGYAPPVYSYSMKCARCKETHFYSNLAKYLAVSFLPLTIFYMTVMLFRVSVTSGPMVAYVLLSQMVGSPILIRLFLEVPKNYMANQLNILQPGKIAIIFAYSVWNLETLGIMVPEFCLHPKMETLDMLMLDYLIGIYPLLLILLTYLAVSLHDRSSILVLLWTPFYKCFSCIRKEWDIRGSLIQGFATFIVLSYVKILDVSFNILIPVRVFRTDGKSSFFVYYAGDTPFLGKYHIPYACIALLAFILLNLLPVFLLLLYPIRKFRRLLEYFKLHTQSLYAFMDAFQGCYKYRPVDCRYFAGLYLLLRIVQLISFSVMQSPQYLAVTGFMLLITAMLVTYVRPYKNDTHNKIDSGFFLLFGGGHFIYLFFSFELVLEGHDTNDFTVIATTVLGGLVLTSLPLYGLGFFIQNTLPNATKEKIKKNLTRCWAALLQVPGLEHPQDSSLPHRIENLENDNTLPV